MHSEFNYHVRRSAVLLRQLRGRGDLELVAACNEYIDFLGERPRFDPTDQELRRMLIEIRNCLQDARAPNEYALAELQLLLSDVDYILSMLR